MRLLRDVSILAVVVIAVVHPARAVCPLADPADCIYVDVQSCPGPGAGLQADPYCSIQDALDFALAGDTVLVLPGTYLECVANVGINKSVDLLADAYLANPVPASRELTTIDGSGICDGTTIDPSTGFIRDEPTVLLGGSSTSVEGFTVTGGGISGIAVRGGARITNNIVRGNESVLGGGIYVYTASCDYPGDVVAEISNNLVENNNSVAPTNDVNLEQSGDGGGVYVAAVGTQADQDCFSGDVDVLVTGNLVQNNTVQNDNLNGATGRPFSALGGGVVATTDSDAGAFARVVISQNVISGNGPAAGSLSYGGGVWAQTYGFGQETIEIRDNTVTGNTSSGDGGGLSAWSDSFVLAEHVIEVDDNVVANNVALGNGGGVDLFVIARDLDPAQIVSMSAQRNTIAGNDASGFGGGGGGALVSSLAFRSTTDKISFDVSSNEIRGNTSQVSGGGVGLVLFADADTSSDFNVTPPVCGTTLPASTIVDFLSNMVVDNTVVGIAAPDPGDPVEVGGGVYVFTQAYGEAVAQVNIDSATIAGNGTVAGSGGVEVETLTDLDCVTLNDGSGELLINNTIIANNDGFGIGGPAVGAAGVLSDGSGTENLSVVVTGSDVIGNLAGDYERAELLNPGGGNISVDPLFRAEPLGDYRLGLGSSLIDAGTVGTLSVLDFEGNARVVGAAVDIGADELDSNADADEDGVADVIDNCPDDSNPGQEDGDADGIGDVCDCVDLDGDGYGSPAGPECDAGLVEDCDDTNRICGASCDFELCSGNAGLDSVRPIADIDGDGTIDLLVTLTDPLTAVTTLAIYDSTSGLPLRTIATNPSYLSAGIGLAANVGGTAAPEVGVLGIRADGLALLQLRDSDDGSVVANVFFPNDLEPRDVEIFEGYPGISGSVAGVLGFSTIAGRAQLLLRRVDTGAVVDSIVFNPAYDPKALEILPDVGGTSAPEVVMLGQSATGLTLAQVRDSSTGQNLQNVFFSSIDVPMGMTIVEGIPGFGPTIGVFGHHKILDRIVLELREAASGDFVRTVVSHQDFPATQFSMLSSYAGSSAPEVVFAGDQAANGLVLTQSRDTQSGLRLDNVFFGSTYDVRSVTTRLTFDGELRWEVIVLGRDRLTGAPRVQVRDMIGGALIDTFFPGAGSTQGFSSAEISSTSASRR